MKRVLSVRPNEIIIANDRTIIFQTFPAMNNMQMGYELKSQDLFELKH